LIKRVEYISNNFNDLFDRFLSLQMDGDKSNKEIFFEFLLKKTQLSAHKKNIKDFFLYCLSLKIYEHNLKNIDWKW